MMVLWEQPDEALTVGAVGERVRMDTGTLTPLLKRLEQAGLIRRTRDASDERRVLLELTDDGLAIRDRVAAVPFRPVDRAGIDPQPGTRVHHDHRPLPAALG